MNEQQLNTLKELQDLLGYTTATMKEYKLFNVIKDTCFSEMTSTSVNQYEKHDGIINNGAVEFKCRYKHYSTLRIERDKYNHLQQFKQKYYICSTPEGIFAFNLDKDLTNINWEMTWNPATTSFGNRQMVLKETYDIPILEHNDITLIILNRMKNKLTKNK